MFRWFRYGLAVVAGLTLALIVLTFLINSIDQKLRPEVKAILDKPLQVTDTQKRAYFFVLGVYAGETADPEKKGAELWEQREQPGFWQALETKDPFSKEPEAHLKDYIKLMEYGEGITLFRGNGEIVFPHISGLPFSPHRAFLQQLGEWSRSGGQLRVIDLLVSSNHYARSFLNQANLLETMLAVVMISQNAAFVKSEMERNPKFPVTQDLLESFTIPRSEDILFNAIEVEVSSVNLAMQSIKKAANLKMINQATDKAFEESAAGKLPTAILFRPNEAVNRYYEIVTQSLTADCLGNIEYVDCVPAARWAYPRYPWSWISNPIGRVLVRLMSASVGGHRHKIDQRRHDVAIVQEMIREKL